MPYPITDSNWSIQVIRIIKGFCCQNLENSGISSSEIFETLQEKVYCYSSDVFMKRSTYVGRDVSSMVPRSLFISPPIE